MILVVMELLIVLGTSIADRVGKDFGKHDFTEQAPTPISNKQNLAIL
jgi:hypothetical protein